MRHSTPRNATPALHAIPAIGGPRTRIAPRTARKPVNLYAEPIGHGRQAQVTLGRGHFIDLRV